MKSTASITRETSRLISDELALPIAEAIVQQLATSRDWLSQCTEASINHVLSRVTYELRKQTTLHAKKLLNQKILEITKENELW